MTAGVAAGHPATADSAAEILADGGNAVDAALAGLLAACVAEPVLCGPGGGGFLLTRAPEGAAEILDFFCQTPRARAFPHHQDDVEPAIADYGPKTQTFHIGHGTTATPGFLPGLFEAHRRHCRLPFGRLVEPAVRLARAGVPMSALQAHILEIVAPIYLATPETRALFESRCVPGTTLRPGECVPNPALADCFEALGRDGEALYRHGEIGRRLVAPCRESGGHLSMDDVVAYRPEIRRALAIDHAGARIWTNPPPSTGGLLIAFGLEMLKVLAAEPMGTEPHPPPGWAARIARALRLTDEARRAIEEESHAPQALEGLLDPDRLARWRAACGQGRPVCHRGTSHLSIVDHQGGVATATVSNGEGAGRLDPVLGFMPNNMLGEEDINPAGIGKWQPDTRMGSMMAPTAICWPDGRIAALGSGGANRIRSAILQVLVNLTDAGLTAEAAVQAPRLHLAGGHLDIEPGWSDAAVAAAEAEATSSDRWPHRSMYFGGVHLVCRHADGAMAAVGDPRRGGVGRIVPVVGGTT